MPEPDKQIDEVELVKAEIEQKRHELADTVDALSEKLNVKAQARSKLADVQAKVQPHRTELAAGTGVFVVAIAALIVWRRRSS